MPQTPVLTGKEFNEIIENAGKRPPRGVYIGFSASSRTKTVYRARFDASAVKLDGNKISGMFEHSIYKRQDKMGDPTELAKECFEGVWFADEGRMLVRGIKWAEGSMHKELEIFKENYDFFFKDDTMVGNWASGGKPGEPKLNDEAKFDQPMCLQRIPDAVARMSEEGITEYMAKRDKYNVDRVFDLLNSVGEGTSHKVKVVLKVEAITGIEQVSQTFGTFAVSFEWSPSLRDIYYLISSGSDEKWTPEWMPPTPFLVNRPQNTEEVVEGTPEMTQKEGNYVISKAFAFKSIPLESLEVNKYHIKVKIPGSENAKFDVSTFMSANIDSANVEKQSYDEDGNFSVTLVASGKDDHVSKKIKTN